MRATLWLFFGLLCAVIVGCTASAPLHFSHKAHLTEIKCGGPGQPDCLSCTTCHTRTAQSPSGIGKPTEAACTSCHKPTDTRKLAAVHGDVTAPPPTGRSIIFNHDKHLAMPQIVGQCVPCHGGNVKEATAFPPMSKCMDCHEHEAQWQKTECTPCHAPNDLAHLQPQTFLRHDQAFIRKHGADSQSHPQLCKACHTEATCNACHDVTQTQGIEKRQPDAIEKQFVHRADFMTRHAIESKSQPTKCLTCHQTQTCDACHVERGVSGNAKNGVNPHPVGWVQSPHGKAARRDVTACASCHDAGPTTNCIRCHKSGAYGGNPHPVGFTSNVPKTDTPCRYCHE